VERQNRIVTILSLLLLALVAVAVLGEKPERSADDAEEGPPSERAFPDLASSDVQQIALKRADGELAFERVDGAWRMTAPRTVAVEDRKVQEVADRFANVELTERTLSQPASAYGLDAAQRVEVVLTTSAGITHRLFVGLDAPVGYASYVSREADGSALVASSQLRDLAARSADDFRSRALLALSPGTARRIRIADGERVAVLREDDHGWWLGDEGPRASADAVETWLSDLSAARVTAFLDDADPATLGLDAPQVSITVEDAGGSHTVRVAGRTDAEAVAVGDEAPVRVGADVLALVRVSGWEDPKLLPVRRAQVDGIEVTLGGRTLKATRTDGAWKTADGADVSVEALLDALAAVPADRSRSDLPAPAADGRIVLSEGPDRREAIVFGPTGTDGRRGARDEAGGPPFQVEQAALDAVLAAMP
jgi:hypothetical protein